MGVGSRLSTVIAFSDDDDDDDDDDDGDKEGIRMEAFTALNEVISEV